MDFLLSLNSLGLINGAHDVSDGGLLPCLIEMLLKKIRY